MSSIDISMDITQAQKQVSKIGRGLDFQKAFKFVAVEHLQWIGQNFKEQGKEQHWKPLRPATLEARRTGKKKRLGKLILIDTANLRDSFIGEKGILKRGYNFITVGTTVQYASTHEFGEPARHIPKRKILPSDKLAKTLAQNILQAWVDKVVKDAGT